MSEQTNRIEAELAEDRARLSETVEELGDKLAPQRIVHEASRALGWGAQELATAVATQVRERPIPTLVTAIGLAWLVLGSRNSNEQTAADESVRTDPVDYPTAEELNANSAWERYQETSWSTMRGADEEETDYERRLLEERAQALGVVRRNDEDDVSFKDRVSFAAQKAKNFALVCRSKLKNAADRAGRKISDAAADAADAVGSAATAAKDGVAGAANAVGDAVSAGAAKGERALKSARKKSVDFHDEHPFATGAIGFAIGAMAGSAMPLTTIERARLQGLVDKGINRSADAVTDAAKAVGAFARDVRDTGQPY